jgi:superfamily II DNA or RNA helicase
MEIIGDAQVALKFDVPEPVRSDILDAVPEAFDTPDGLFAKWDHDTALQLAEAIDRHQPADNLPQVISPICRDYTWPGMFKPFDHQRVTASFLSLRRRAHCFNETGCVDADTEYLSPTGWVKISEYVGGKVAQFVPETGKIEFVDPTEYVKKPCAEMIEFKSKYGINQRLSPEHRVLHYKTDRNADDSAQFWRVDSAEVLYGGLRDKRISSVFFKTTYETSGGPGIPLTDAQLRLQIAVIADGYFANATDLCIVRVKKPRKIERLRTSLAAAGVEFTETTPEYKGAEGFHTFKFRAPLRVKEFGPEFWEATPHQLGVVTDEVVHWDGSFRKSSGRAFYSTSKASADFVQHAFCAQGFIARITDDGRGCWQVYARSDAKLIGITNKYGSPGVQRVPSTDGFKYCFSVPSTYLAFRRNGCVFMSGNTGKTASAIWAADYLMNIGKVQRVLIVCPLSIMQTAWQRDIFQTAMHRRSAVAYGDRAKRVKIIKSDAEFVVINYDGIPLVLDELLAGGFDLIIVDEASHVKNNTTKRWKVINKLAKPNSWLWLMTATPAAQSPMDAYGLAKLVAPHRIPKTRTDWQARVMTQFSRFVWAPKHDHRATVLHALQPAIRFAKADCLDLPPVVYETRNVEMSPQASAYYEKLKHEQKFLAGEEVVTAVNAAAQLNKLLQISSGCVYSQTGEVLEFDVRPRLHALDEVLDETSNKVIVFATFRHAIESISEHLKKQGVTVDVIHGDVPPARRATIISAFQQSEDPRVLVIQPQSAAHGVTLTAADTLVFWSPVASVETYIQCIGRIDRVGQVHKCVVVHLQGSPAERHVYKMLQGKVDIHQKIVSLYREILEE